MDKTNFAQSLMHMIKGNLGTGILAMPASFAHTGLVNATIGLPFLCLISTYCVHLLIKSSRHLGCKTNGLTFNYTSLAKHSFRSGPKWMSVHSSKMCLIVDALLLIAQIGVCCVYIIFVVDNIVSILSSYRIFVPKLMIFFAVLPIALLLSYIRTLKRLAIASAFANLLQTVGISIILNYLVRDLDKVDLKERDMFMPLKDVALGFGSAMFAFEGICVVLPVYTRMKHPEKMSGLLGLVNIAYGLLLILYFAMGLIGYLKFGRGVRDSITLNLPPEPLYDGVRALFATSVILTYPLQFYVPNEIIWNWAKRNLLMSSEHLDLSVIRAVEVVIPVTETQVANCIRAGKVELGTSAGDQIVSHEKQPKACDKQDMNYVTTNAPAKTDLYEYLCRTIVVISTFVLAISVPKLNLLMDLIGSITGTSLSLIIPAIIHIGAFWDDTRGIEKVAIVLFDLTIIVFGLTTGISGSIFSISSILASLEH